MLALKGITKFRSPTKADVTSPNIQTTTWPLSTVMEASLRVCREQRDGGEQREKGMRRSADREERKRHTDGTEMSAVNRKPVNVREVTNSRLNSV